MERGKRAVNRAKCLLQHASNGHVTDESVPKIYAESGKIRNVADFTSSEEDGAESGLVLDERILFLKQMNAMKNFTSTIKKGSWLNHEPEFSGGPSGTRTPNQLIKSQLLYQLS